MKNRAIIDMMEPGSTFKIVAAAAALNERKLRPDSEVFCENGLWKFGGGALHDHRSFSYLSVRDILIKSSNIGAAKLALSVGEQKFYEYIRRFGFGERTGIELPGEINGLIRPPQSWSKISIPRIPMGHEIGVTPLQMTVAIAAIANGGKLITPRIVKSITTSEGKTVSSLSSVVLRQVISPETAREIGDALRGVVSDRGTAAAAAVPGFVIAGKTGTAQKVDPKGGYEHGKYVVSFAGYLPADHPEVVGLVVLDDAHTATPELNYGGIVAGREEKDSRATFLVVEDTRSALTGLAATFYRRPADRLKIAGVTGTNGKTTTTFLIKHICEKAGLRCGLIGTVRYEIGERVLPAARTTPESLDLQELLAQIANAGCRAAAMEVSSHALTQERVRGLEWDVAVFTNLTQDHLDYHGTMENYFEAKAKLFKQLQLQGKKKKPLAIINIDDRYGRRLLEKIDKKVSVVSFGMGALADFRASNYRMEFGGTSYQLDARGKSYLVRVPLIGRFNVANSMAALAAAKALGIGLREAVLSLAKSPQVPGRLEMVPAKRQFQVFVDYAHTPDALLNVLKTLRELGPRRLIVVFCCGVNWDREKRPLMGQVVDQNADYAVITSDNPRKEDPDKIIAEIEKGFRGNHFEKITDRASAISRAIEIAQPRDIVLIAGKGHENYQEFSDHTVPFEDIQVARRALENHPVEFK